jgi:hypothetical protein
MLTLNLSTISDNLLTTATIDRGVRRVCSICGGTAAECLCVTQNPVALGDDKSKGDGSHDDPHNDIVARLERCLDVVMGDEPITVKQDEAMSLTQWMAWSMGVVDPRPCTDEDPCGNAMCGNCG